MTNLLSAILVLAALAFVTELFYYIPMAALGAIVEVALINLWDYEAFIEV